MTPEGVLEINKDRRMTRVRVSNLADRPIQIGSHYHFAEANKYLTFDRELAYGKRLVSKEKCVCECVCVCVCVLYNCAWVRVCVLMFCVHILVCVRACVLCVCFVCVMCV